jgi:hypothetical protein
MLKESCEVRNQDVDRQQLSSQSEERWLFNMKKREEGRGRGTIVPITDKRIVK